jgi:hypothetical protein
MCAKSSSGTRTSLIARRALVLLACSIPCASLHGAQRDARKSTVGMPARIEQIVLPGSELEARPAESREAPLVVRIVAPYPHGTAFRYDLEFCGLEPGRYDLAKYLKRKDGSTSDDLPELAVEVSSLLEGGQILPNDLESRAAPRLGGYRLLLVVAAVAWLCGLAAILLLGRHRRSAARQAASRSVSLAERLRPLVERAVEGKLDGEGQAQLERLLLTYWRRRLNLQAVEPFAAVALLREHEQAGALLRQVEAWLHKPGGAGEVDLAVLLAPYRDLPGEPASGSANALAQGHDVHAASGGGRP